MHPSATNLQYASNNILQAVLITGGVAGGAALRRAVQRARAEQKRLADEVAPSRRGRASSAVAVDAVFLRRLMTILKQ